MLELFVVGTIGFWILVSLEILLLFFCTAKELGGLAFVSILAVLLGLNYFGNVDIIGAFGNHPGLAALLIVSYFASGTIWAVCKWWFFVQERRRKYAAMRQRFMEAKKLPIDSEIPEDMKEKFLEHCRNHFGYSSAKPNVGEYKGKILFWMTYWPISLCLTILDDPIRRLFAQIYRIISATLQRISDSAFREFEKDLEK
jgi:hypothetical protein